MLPSISQRKHNLGHPASFVFSNHDHNYRSLPCTSMLSLSLSEFGYHHYSIVIAQVVVVVKLVKWRLLSRLKNLHKLLNTEKKKRSRSSYTKSRRVEKMTEVLHHISCLFKELNSNTFAGLAGFFVKGTCSHPSGTATFWKTPKTSIH